KEQVLYAFQAASVVNEIKKELYNAIRDQNKQKIQSLRKNLERWTIRWVKARKDSTFFCVVSSFVNSDVLTDGFFTDSLKALGIEEFKTSILSFRAQLKKGEKFYINLNDRHFYGDGVINSYYDKYGLLDEI